MVDPKGLAAFRAGEDPFIYAGIKADLKRQRVPIRPPWAAAYKLVIVNNSKELAAEVGVLFSGCPHC